MSKTNELLNSLSNDDIALYTANPDTEPHIVVGEDRIVVVPEELQRIAVQRDHLIETVTFDCPRYWDGHDMSKMVIYVNYLPPNITEAGSYICKNVCVDETNPSIMHFDWTITENVTVNEGRLIFLVDVKGANGEHWHSELNEEMYISEGIEPPPFIDIPNPDILTQVLLFNANILELSDITLKRAAVYVGSGEMPDGYNVQVDPDGESDFERIVEDATHEYLQDYAPAVYVGSGEMPEGYNIQIDPEGEGEVEAAVRTAAEAVVEDVTQEYLQDYAPAVYIGSGEMPDGYMIQIDPDGDEAEDGEVSGGGSGSGDVDLSEVNERIDQLSEAIGDQKTTLDNAVLSIPQTLTETQKAQVRANIGATAGEDVEFADSVEWLDENGDTSKKYVLPDGYIYTWMYKSELVEHNANDGTGYLNATPTDTWGNTPYTRTGGWTSPLISIDPTKIAPVGNPTESSVTISGIEKVVGFYNGYSVIVFYYKSDGSQMFMKTNTDLGSIEQSGEISVPFTFQLKDTNIFADSNWANVYGVRISLGISSDTITAADVENIKVNIPFFNYEKTGYGWYSTGQQHSNDKATQQNSADIATLKEEVTALKEAVQKSPSASGAVWYAIGDSITYGLYSTSTTEYSQPVVGQRWVDYVAQYNGYELTNLGVSGSGFVSGTTFRTIVDRNDFSGVDLVTIMLGINDWKNEAAVSKVGTIDDDISTGGTIVSELRYGLEKIISDNPYCKIILITPINAKIGSRGTEATNWAYGFTGTITPCGSLKNFGDKLKEVCEYYGIQVVDMSNSSVVNRKSITTVLPDGIHPNLECYKALGLELARRITFA